MKNIIKIGIVLIIVSISCITTSKVKKYLDKQKMIKQIKQFHLEQEKNRPEKERLEKIRDEEFRKELKTKEPYIGLEDIYVDETIWGKPDKVELSLDYWKMIESRRYKYYTWNGGEKYFRKITVHEGKVHEIIIRDNEGLRVLNANKKS
ncbi:hypothetical protein [Clostridium baratii]|uniref:hypothetical protein n=1 Tax=Clostridium baratii TaxID=1561 RepID=UPI001C24A971|nr:hypothetical protein [Clostridium baratii]